MKSQSSRRALRVAKAALLSVSTIALTIATLQDTRAQTAPAPATEQQPGTQLPTVEVSAPNRRPRQAPSRPRQRAGRTTARNRARTRQPVQRRQPEAPVQAAPLDTQETRTGAVGVYSNSTSVATKTNTLLINIPQSVNVLTKDYIKDQNFQNIDDTVRYVPSVVPHQGEGNRDELVIRGVDSSANFFVNGFRDDVQYFRDLYNTQSIEVLKGPSALIFGRGAGGGLLNRTLKEADWSNTHEATLQTGSYGDRRGSIDVDKAFTEDFAARLNAFYEASDTFRDFGHLERYGINPTVTWKPNDSTKINLSYEYYHDERLADRGNPSIAVPGGATRFNPTTPFVSDWSTFFGDPKYNRALSNVNTFMGSIEHDFGNGLTVRNALLAADYQRMYRNVFPGSAADLSTDKMTLSAYQNTTNRDNVFDQTDFTYKTATGPVFHTLTFGTEFGRQSGLSKRDTGVFANTNGLADTVNPFDPTYFGDVNFIHNPSGTDTSSNTYNITTDANSRYHLNIASAYVQDQIDITRWLQVIAGVRYDRFDLTALDQNTNITRNRVDENFSPRAAVMLKPQDDLSFYVSYSISYLPASGDQFSALSNGTLLLDPQKFENKEIGVKWNIQPHLTFTAAAYDLERTNVPLADPNNTGFFILSGKNRIRGFETSLNGYITDRWQSSFGYAYTDARVTSDTSATILAGNRVQLVPYNQFSWWNKYQIDSMWSAAVGVIYFSDSYASSDDTVRLPGFVRVDAAIYAKINETWKAQLNIENIVDKGYWATADGNNNISPGQPRTIRLVATANF